MATKQIQLRGISRTPSDRLTNDGGCAESLNVQLDNTELAPSFYPDDVTIKRGLPADLEAEKIFIHKTANYENYIVVQSDRVVAYTPDIEDEEPLTVLDLAEGEEVNDITSVGNTIVVATSFNLYYSLFENYAYSYLGNKIHFPQIKCWSQIADNKVSRIFKPAGEGMWFNSLPSEDVWNALYNEQEVSNAFLQVKERIENFHTQLWQRINQYMIDGRMVGQAVLRYAVELYDGSLLSSLPLIIGASVANPLEVELKVKTEYQNSSAGNTIVGQDNEMVITMSSFKTYAKLESDVQELLKWKDIVRSLKIYVSIPTTRSYNKKVSKMVNVQRTTTSTGQYTYETKSTANLLLGSKAQAENPESFTLENTSLAHLVAELDVSGLLSYRAEGQPYSFQDLIDGCDLSRVLNLSDEDIAKGEILIHDDMQHYTKTSNKLSAYNGALILCGNSQMLSYDYNNLCSLIKETGHSAREYFANYYIKTPSGERVVSSGPFEYSEEVPYAFQFFPDSRAYKMVLHMKRDGQIFHGSFEMEPHPFLACAYANVGLGHSFDEYIDELGELLIINNPKEVIGNKLLLSNSENPFVFPVERQYTFQSPIIDVAIATTTLSQGQFGQFPLYVFTKDGIWAMETGADGSFVSQKPLSRDVCINPDSITSLDNGVVFVTAQGVMLIQGSQVTNISPFMNGRHYTVEESAKNIINGQQDFKDFIPVIEDETHFLAFMRAAKIAYDYTGRRLIFIKEGEQYQYIYKLDTQTWHKSAYGMNLIAPINSYPECLATGKGEEYEKIFLKITSIAESQLDLQELSRGFISIFNSYGLRIKGVMQVFMGQKLLNITEWSDAHLSQMRDYLETNRVYYEIVPKSYITTKVLDLSTVLDAAESKTPTKGVIATRPLDLGEPDVFKTITDIRVRGQYPKGAVKFILLGSNDGVKFYTINTLRGKAWKLFRIIILADLQPTDRISWIDVQYETKFTNKLR